MSSPCRMGEGGGGPLPLSKGPLSRKDRLVSPPRRIGWKETAARDEKHTGREKRQVVLRDLYARSRLGAHF